LRERLWAIWNAARWQAKLRYGYAQSSAFYDNRAREIIADAGVDLYAGCYANRAQRGSTATSSHAWGAAVDWNPAENAMGTKGCMPKWWVNVWTAKIGDIRWTWGGSWLKLRRDPMHVEVEWLG
jgi:hypothetical protein